MIRKILCIALIVFFPVSASFAAEQWEKQGHFYYLAKNTRESFGAKGAGANKFTGKYLTVDGISFLVKGADTWKDYGRLDLEGDNLFNVPIRSGMKVDELHFLAGGNFGNDYEHDKLLHLYGDNYYYATITVIFAYQDGTYKEVSLPIFWDWFHLISAEWSKDGAKIKYVGANPVRKDCGIYHISIVNPRASEPVKDILVTDSWLSDIPYSEIFSLTLKSSDKMQALPKKDKHFKFLVNNASNEPADTRTEWKFNIGLDGWIAGCSANWNSDSFWQADSFGKKGAVVIPACNWAGTKFSWIEKKIALPQWNRINLQFSRRSAAYSQLDKKWTDGSLKVIVNGTAGQETVYDRLYSGEWTQEIIDLSGYKGQTVIIRFESYGAGSVRLSQTSSPLCDAEDAIITEIQFTQK